MTTRFTRTIKTAKHTIATMRNGQLETLGTICTDESTGLKEILVKACEEFQIDKPIIIDTEIESALYECTVDEFLSIARKVIK